MIIRVQNNLDQAAPFSYLTNTTSAGAGTFPVKNINQFSANWAVQFGKSGEEQSEIKVLTGSAPSGTTVITTGTALYEHPADTPVFAIKFDKVVFERSTAGTAGTATPMTNGTVSITPDNTYTQFDDTTGASTYAYKTYFYNSVTADVSSESDWITPAGFSFYSLAKIRQRIKSKLVSANYIKDDATIDDWINEWLETMNNVAIDVNQDYQLGTVDVGFSGTAELGTITATDFKEIRKVLFTTNGSDCFKATKLSIIGFAPQQTFNATHPYFYMQGDNVIGRKPADSSGTARITYYKLNPVLVNDTDELPTSMHGYTKSFVDYGAAQAFNLDTKFDIASSFEQRANAGLEKFRLEITPRSKSGVNYITLVESVDIDDSFEFP